MKPFLGNYFKDVEDPSSLFVDDPHWHNIIGSFVWH
jgi:hypothetical protein